MSWVSDAYATGPVSRWPGITAISVDISGSNPAVALPEDVLYSFGTGFGSAAWSNPLDGIRCDASSSSVQSGSDARTLGNRTVDYFSTQNTAGQWVAFDFDVGGAGYRVNLDAFAWQHVPSFPDFRLVSFVVEAGNGASLAAATWESIATISDASFLPNAASSWSSIRPLIQTAEPYRFLRITSTGTDSNGLNHTMGAEVIFGGLIFPPSAILSGGGSPAPSPAPPGTTEIVVDITGADLDVAYPQDVLYTFGTDFGASAWSNPLDGIRCSASASSLKHSGLPSTLGNRVQEFTGSFSTEDDGPSWLIFDFDASGAGHRVNLDAFAWQHPGGARFDRMANFIVEAGNGADAATATWTTIATISDPNFIPNVEGASSAVTPLLELAEPYRFVRFTTTADSSGGSQTRGCEVVFGGSVFQAT
ncbi:MAG: hypothetical protein AAGF75_05190 [Cyanobacteria bacterium P01_H01_bin.130]